MHAVPAVERAVYCASNSVQFAFVTEQNSSKSEKKKWSEVKWREVL